MEDSSSTSLLPHSAEVPLADDVPVSLRSPYPALSSPPSSERPLHVVLASSGSVASIKVPLIAQRLLEHANVRIQIIATKASLAFYETAEIEQLESAGAAFPAYGVAALAEENRAATFQDEVLDGPRIQLWTDDDEWADWKQVGDPILHIELRRWADVVLIAPCSANTLAKIAGGICDNLLTSFLRALSPETPTILFPAMNTLMWLHPLTQQHLTTAENILGYEVKGPISKRLACGDLGAGAMYEWADIVELVVDRFGLVPALPPKEAIVPGT